MTRRRQPPAVIRADAAYRLDDFRARTGMGEWAMREARRAGLRVVTVGGKRWIRGADFLDFLAARAEAQG